MKLLYLSSRYIRDFCSRNPIEWFDDERHKARLGGSGNITTPYPAMGVFYWYLAKLGKLFTQAEFWEACQTAWKRCLPDWECFKDPEKQRGMQVRTYRNFYVSGVDTVYVWALFVEHGGFDCASTDIVNDVVGKVDLSVTDNQGRTYWVNLRGPGPVSDQCHEYKELHRPGPKQNVFDVPMTLNRPKSPGNKRWFELSDFSGIFETKYVLDANCQPSKSDTKPGEMWKQFRTASQSEFKF